MKTYKGRISKEIKIKLVGDAEKAYTELTRKVKEQKQRNTKKSKEITLLEAINKTFQILKTNPFYGENSKKKLIPKEYKEKYDATNLFITDLPDYWRMIYTLESDEIEIITFILDIISHDKYNKKFGFRKK